MTVTQKYLSSHSDNQEQHVTPFDNTICLGLDGYSTTHTRNVMNMFLKQAITEVIDSNALGDRGLARVTKKVTVHLKLSTSMKVNQQLI